LFGHNKGAFTGAISAQPGKFELAQGGTLLLDEISELPLNLQAKLLRVLQEKEVERLGSNQTIALDVRIIAASNKDL
ncbi:sigma 54-interacting transcriptional regulator, partial [Aeromonas veronii]